MSLRENQRTKAPLLGAPQACSSRKGCAQPKIPTGLGREKDTSLNEVKSDSSRSQPDPQLKLPSPFSPESASLSRPSFLTPFLLALPAQALTKGFSPTREASRKACRSPCFIKGRMTIGMGRRPLALLRRLTPGQGRVGSWAHAVARTAQRPHQPPPQPTSSPGTT